MSGRGRMIHCAVAGAGKARYLCKALASPRFDSGAPLFNEGSGAALVARKALQTEHPVVEFTSYCIKEFAITTRQEHLDWCKRRALEYVQSGDFSQAVASMLSDLRKHPETEGHIGIELGSRMLFADLLNTDREVRKWLEGFN